MLGTLKPRQQLPAACQPSYWSLSSPDAFLFPRTNHAWRLQRWMWSLSTTRSTARGWSWTSGRMLHNLDEQPGNQSACRQGLILSVEQLQTRVKLLSLQHAQPDLVWVPELFVHWMELVASPPPPAVFLWCGWVPALGGSKGLAMTKCPRSISGCTSREALDCRPVSDTGI